MEPTEARLNKLSDICADISQISVASIVIPFAIDKSNIPVISLGIVAALIFWGLSYHLAR